MAKKTETGAKGAPSKSKKADVKPLSSSAAEIVETPPTPAPGPLKKAAVAKKAPAKAAGKAAKVPNTSFTTEEIALRAYFIAENRHRHGFHGDEHSDWIEAERQLRHEAKTGTAKPAKAKKAGAK